MRSYIFGSSWIQLKISRTPEDSRWCSEAPGHHACLPEGLRIDWLLAVCVARETAAWTSFVRTHASRGVHDG